MRKVSKQLRAPIAIRTRGPQISRPDALTNELLSLCDNRGSSSRLCVDTVAEQ